MLLEPRVAVVVPNKNDSKYLPSCLESILCQKSLPDEIIIVDDASTDNSLEIINEYKNKFANCRVLRNRISHGAMSAINQGVKVSSSDFTLFVSSNDIIDKNIIFEFRKSIAKLKIFPGVWSAQVNCIDKYNNIIGPHFSPLVSSKLKFFSPSECIKLSNRLGNWFTGITVFYNTSELKKIGGFDPQIGGLGDLFLALQLAAKKGAIFLPMTLGSMRIHEGGLLKRTLINAYQIDNLLYRIFRVGLINTNELFVDNFIIKTTARIRFASIREMILNDSIRIPRNWKNKRTEIFNFFVGKISKKLLIIFAYALFRPFDLYWTFYYRGHSFFFFYRRMVLKK